MRVGINARAFLDEEPRGSVLVGIELAGALQARDDVSVVLYSHPSVGRHVEGASVVGDGFGPRSQVYGLAWEQVALPRLLGRDPPDVLLCPNENPPLRSVDPPVVVTVHDIFAYHGLAPRAYHWLQRIRAPHLLDAADVVVAVSEYTKRDVEATLDPNPPVTVVHNGISDAYFEPPPDAAVDLPEEYVLFVGGSGRRKNRASAIEAFDLFRRKRGFEYDLVLVGPGEKLIDEDGAPAASDAVHDLGFVERETLRVAYDRADAFLFPSLAEGFGVPPLEAMASGTPVVAADRPCLPEVLGDAAHFVDPTEPGDITDGLDRVLSDGTYAQSLVERGRERARRFTWERAADRFVDLFEAVT